MRFNPISRRHFLQGLGGTTLSLPLLTSLIPKSLLAQSQSPKSEFFIGIYGGGHGGILRKSVIGDKAALLSGPAFTQRLYYAGGMEGSRRYTDHFYRYARLQDLLDTSGGTPRLSPYVGSEFNPFLSKMNLIDGLGLCERLGHHKAIWGNFPDNDQSDQVQLLPGIASIDTIMAASSSVYSSMIGVSMPHVRIGRSHTGHGPMAHDFQGQKLQNNITRPNELMALFTGGVTNSPSGDATLVVDRVYEDYVRLLSPAGLGSKISQLDRIKVEAAMQSLFQIEQSLNSLSQCGDYENPFTNNQQFFSPITQEKADVILPIISQALAHAINCGLTKVVNFNPAPWFNELCGTSDSCVTNDYHDDIAHKACNPDGYAAQQALHMEQKRKHFSTVFRNVIAALDSIPVDGGTLLDKGQVHYVDEAGLKPSPDYHMNHFQWNIIAITAGGGNDYYRTGYYINYINQEPIDLGVRAHPGVLLNQYYTTVLNSMGVPSSEYQNPELFGGPGYSYYLFRPSYNTTSSIIAYSNYYVQQKSGLPLPYIVRSQDT